MNLDMSPYDNFKMVLWQLCSSKVDTFGTSYGNLVFSVKHCSNQGEKRGALPLNVPPETLYHRDNALLYIAYVMFIWAAPIPADRWHCSLWP